MRIALKSALLCVALTGYALAITGNSQAAEQSAAKPAAKKQKTTAAKPKSVPPVKKAKASSTVKHSSALIAAGSIGAWKEARALAVQSGAALVIDQNAGDALFQKNAGNVVPIASITKLMTAMVVLDSAPNLQALVSISEEDIDTLRGSHSRLHVGSVMARETALLLALMSSENRAANSLARHYPGGMSAFLAAMNLKAQALGMTHTRFEDPTGLTSSNVSTAHDLAKMVAAAYRYPLIREFSTTPGTLVEISGREMSYRNTNPLVKNPSWEVGLSKTGYIHEAGKCLVMQARVADKAVVIVLLDSAGKMTRVGDANRIKRWMESAHAAHKNPTHTAAVAESSARKI